MVARVSMSVLSAISLLLTRTIASAQSTPVVLTPDQVAKNMQATYGPTKAFSADFEQRYHAKAFNKKIESTGHVVIEKPDHLLFTYSKPIGDVTVSDGKWMRMYTAASKESIEGPASKSMIPAAFSFLTSTTPLSVNFNLTLLPAGQCMYPDGHCLVAKPKVATTAYAFVIFKIASATWTVTRVTIVDAGGNSNRFTFTATDLKPVIAAGTFAWKPPAGTTVKPLP